MAGEDDDDALAASWGAETEAADDDALAAAWGAETEAAGDDALAAAWGAEADGAADDSRTAMVLNQDEIDSLLGFDGPGADREGVSCMQRIIDAGLVNHERLPMLEIVFDRLARILSTSLRNFTGDNVEVSVSGVISMRFGDYLNTIPMPCMLAVFTAEEWDNQGLILVDSAMIYSIVDVLLGGRASTTTVKIDGRPYTTIERALIERLIRVVLEGLSESFDPVCAVNFRHDRLETDPRFAAISRRSNATILVRVDVEMDDRRGRLEVLLPYATLEPVREMLLQQFIGEKFGRDMIWETHLSEELRRTDIVLDVVLAEQTMRLSDIASLKPGDSITLDTHSGAPVQLRCGTTPLYEGHLGRSKNHVAVRIDRRLDTPEA